MLFDAAVVTQRDTSQIVAGREWELNNGWHYELSANYGRYDEEVTATGQVIIDRFFAAIDAVTDPATNRAACRCDVDPAAPAMNTPFGIPNCLKVFLLHTRQRPMRASQHMGRIDGRDQGSGGLGNNHHIGRTDHR